MEVSLILLRVAQANRKFADGGSYNKSQLRFSGRHGPTNKEGKLEDAVVELERKRLNKENERKAAKAMESLNVTTAPASVKEADVELIVSLKPSPVRREADDRFDKLDVRNLKLKRHYVRIKGI
jgi:hypothetical protein